MRKRANMGILARSDILSPICPILAHSGSFGPILTHSGSLSGLCLIVVFSVFHFLDLLIFFAVRSLRELFGPLVDVFGVSFAFCFCAPFLYWAAMASCVFHSFFDVFCFLVANLSHRRRILAPQFSSLCGTERTTQSDTHKTAI